jgi:hypothetical protein
MSAKGTVSEPYGIAFQNSKGSIVAMIVALIEVLMLVEMRFGETRLTFPF